MRIQILLATSLLWLSSCTNSAEKSRENLSETSFFNPQAFIDADTLPVLLPDQESAFNALDTLQLSTDRQNQLYSTFAGINQPCYPPDSSFTISQMELLIALKHFISRKCTALSREKGDELAVKSVSAQQEYTVLLCLDNPASETFGYGPPLKGTWVLQAVLDRRDVVIKW